MACGNNKVSRAGLQTAPTPSGHPSAVSVVSRPHAELQERRAADERQIKNAARAMTTASTRAAIRDLLQTAQRALDDARRAGGDKTQLRILEREVESLQRAANDREGQLNQEREDKAAAVLEQVDRLGRMLLGVPPHLVSRSASKADQALAAGYAKVGGKPINSQYAGQRFPLEEKKATIAAKYPESVKFTESGFPNFSPYAIATVELPYLGVNRDEDFRAADKIRGQEKEEGYTWHHVEDGKTMVLIPTELHQAISHHGGVAHENNIARPQWLLTNYALQTLKDEKDE